MKNSIISNNKMKFESEVSEVLKLIDKARSIIDKFFFEYIDTAHIGISNHEINIQWHYSQPFEYCKNLVVIKVTSDGQYAIIRTPDLIHDERLKICDENMTRIFGAIQNINLKNSSQN